MPHIIGACGFIGTASSAVSDFLKEFDENQALDKFEFKLAYMTDGLDDLRYHLTTGSMKYENGFIAMKRFQKMTHGYASREYEKMSKGAFSKLSDEFIDNLKEGEWVGSCADPVSEPFLNVAMRIGRKAKWFKIVHKQESKYGREIKAYPLQKVFFSINPNNLYSLSQKYTKGVLQAMGASEDKNVILNQPFPGNNPQACMYFYDNPLAIVVDRDPRDLYAQYFVVAYALGERQYPIYDVNQFVTLYRKMRDNMPYKKPDARVLVIRFEDMIYNYDKTSQIIMDFCKLKTHNHPRKYFDPERSINNTQVYKRNEYIRDACKVIEKELTEYLYDFDKYDVSSVRFGDMFEENTLNPSGKKWKP